MHKWHYAGADVQMTIRLIDAYFHRAQGTPIPGKIEALFRLEPSIGSTTKLEPQAEIIDAECRDKAKEVSHFSDDEPVLTAEDWNELEADVGVLGSDSEVDWDDAASDEDWDSDDEDWNSDEQDEGCDMTVMTNELDACIPPDLTDVYSRQVNFLGSSKGNSVCPGVICEKELGSTTIECSLWGISPLNHVI